MASESEIKKVVELLKQRTAERQRVKMDHFLKTHSLPGAMPALVRSVFDISKNLLPTYKNGIDMEMALEVADLAKIYGAVDTMEQEQQLSHDAKYVDRFGKPLRYSDFLVKELLRWFKEDFFKWVNTPECANCHTSDGVKGVGRTRPTQDEATSGGASMVELYQCSRCRAQIRFPRYNKLSKLLSWRQGRCGEWNNCFILFLNAFNIKARYLWNLEDHVWCEYYSEALQRWIHLDSCENSYDQPLLYNEGWGKKMSYVFAIGDDYLIDVSKKYIVKDPLPRKLLPEGQLQLFVNLHNFHKWMPLADLQLYDILVDFNRDYKSLAPKPTQTAELQPRQSGKGRWTETRGEAGS